MKAPYAVWHAHCCESMCDSIIEHGDKEPKVESYIGDHEINKNIRCSKTSWLQPYDPNYRDLANFLTGKMREANIMFGLDVDYMSAMQYTIYEGGKEENAGHYNEHVDIFWETTSMSQRKISMVLQLTDPDLYDGGDLHLKPLWGPAPDPKLWRSRGTMIFFPSFTPHYVTPVTKGIRRSLVVWWEGPPVR